MKLKMVLTSLLASWLFLGGVKAQDPHFSQFFNAPLILNPALTGLIDGDLRINANYRTQWEAVGTPFRTMALSADASVLRSWLGRDVMGVGLLIMNDRAGVSDLRNTQVQLSFAYHKAMNHEGNNLLGFGFQAGYAQQRIDYTQLLFENQFDGGALNPGLPSGEDFAISQFGYFDFSAGLSWSYTPDEFTSYYAGASIFHLNEPNVSFLGDTEERLYFRTTFFAGAEIRINHAIGVVPRLVYLEQGPARELQVGALLKMVMGKFSDYHRLSALYFGSMHRLGDAQVLIARLDYGAVGISFSYDVNFSNLREGSKGRGGTEIALMYKYKLQQPGRRRLPVRCPSF
ncbi:MAG: PorP/SprF family type IX secretion system membrane protein [Bacteroidota bacterium]